jgi:CRP-like cAMP-binding protein
MQSSAGPGRDRAAAHPLTELLACPAATASLLNASATYVEFVAGQTLFRQATKCQGLYLVVSGQLQRRAERLQIRLMLGSVRAGEIVELAAALGDGFHTYTLTAQSIGSVMVLPMEALEQAFRMHPPLRMQLLEELAREVSRAYVTCCTARMAGLRRRPVRDASSPLSS